MDRLCERPGCSERASVACGMRAEDLVFWLDVLPEGESAGGGVLCRRHADSMMVPRGWTLDDRRDPDLHLFRPPTPQAVPASASRRRRAERRRARAGTRTTQLDLAGTVDDPLPVPLPLPVTTARAAPAPPTAESATAVASDASATAGEPVATSFGGLAGEAPDEAPLADEPLTPWTPEFDEADDLDGLLAARSPLLARAFRTADPGG